MGSFQKLSLSPTEPIPAGYNMDPPQERDCVGGTALQTHFGAICGGLSPLEGTPHWSSREEEGGVAETRSDHRLHSPSPGLLDERKAEKNRSEVMPGKEGEIGEDVSKIWIYFSVSYSDLIGN